MKENNEETMIIEELVHKFPKQRIYITGKERRGKSLVLLNFKKYEQELQNDKN